MSFTQFPFQIFPFFSAGFLRNGCNINILILNDVFLNTRHILKCGVLEVRLNNAMNCIIVLLPCKIKLIAQQGHHMEEFSK